jgi:hypothetical protein
MQNQSQQTAIKAAIIQTTATQGWKFMQQLANGLVQRSVVDALEEEDPTKGEAKRLKAAALRKGFSDWFISIEGYKQYTEAPTSDFDDLEETITGGTDYAS